MPRQKKKPARTQPPAAFKRLLERLDRHRDRQLAMLADLDRIRAVVEQLEGRRAVTARKIEE